MKKIKLNRGAEALVDDADYEEVNRHQWIFSNKGYAQRGTKIKGAGTTILMHRQIMGAAKGKTLDHIDGNPLNNQRSNLRYCTASQNHRNRNLSTRNKTGYNGVSMIKTKYSPKKYRAMICADGKNTHLGLFATAEEAVLAYNAAAFQIDPVFSRLG